MVRWTPFVLALLVGIALPGCVDFDAEGQNRIGLVRLDVAAPVVSTGRVTLHVIATLDNLEARSGALNLTFKAFDLATNMLVATETTRVGALRPDVTEEVSADLDLAKASGYRIEVFVEQDGHVVQRGQLQVTNVQALAATTHETGLRISAVEAQVANVTGGKVRVRAAVYLTNEGSSASRPLRLQVKAREVATGLLADEAWLDVGVIREEATQIGTANLLVPDHFNYELQAALWDSDVLVKTGSGRVQFLPTYTQSPGEQLVVSRPDISQFADGQNAVGYVGGDGAHSNTSAQTPGLGLPLLAAAILVALLVRRRLSA